MASQQLCPHKAKLPLYAYEEPVRICKDCLPAHRMRQTAKEISDKVIRTGAKWVDHCVRVQTFISNPEDLPYYTQDWVDSTKEKAVRAGSLAVSGVKLLTPFLSLPYAMGVNAVHAAWNYGQYGLLGLFCSEEIMQGIATLHSMSRELEEVEPKQLLVGMLYLAAEQRRYFRSDPESDHRDVMTHGKPLNSRLLELLIGLAGVGMHAPYEDKAFEAQRLAAQQHWRLVTERLSESGKHQPAWCLYIHEDPSKRVASVAIRGTDLEKSLGGDLFTDVNALPERLQGCDGKTIVAHSGILASARKIEPELRQALRALVEKDFEILVVGHSLGAGVVALLVWLLKYGANGEKLPETAKVYGIGYATPSCVDRRTAEGMKDYFTSVVNSTDIVPRLTLKSIKKLTDEIVQCAAESKSDLNADMESIVDRVANVWAPRFRTGQGTAGSFSRPGAVAADTGASTTTSAAARGAAGTVIATSALAGGTPSAGSASKVGAFLKKLSKKTLSSLELGVEDTSQVQRSVVEEAAATAPVKEGESQPVVLSSYTTTADGPHPETENDSDIPDKTPSAAPAPLLAIPEQDKAVAAEAVAQAAALAEAAASSTLPAPDGPAGSSQDKSYEQSGKQTGILEASEGRLLWVPGGPESVLLAWFGDPKKPWQSKEGVGKMVTEEARSHIANNNMLSVTASAPFGDPCPGTRKKLFLLVDLSASSEELFCPGVVVWLYRLNGSLNGAVVPCNLPSLRRIRCDKRVIEDHGKLCYHRALMTVRARNRASPTLRWQSFAEAAPLCPCCHSRYDWQSSTESEKQRWVWMTNCRMCGEVVCTSCSQMRMALPELGIPDPARVCDRCIWRGPDGDSTLHTLPQLFQNPSSGTWASTVKDN